MPSIEWMCSINRRCEFIRRFVLFYTHSCVLVVPTYTFRVGLMYVQLIMLSFKAICFSDNPFLHNIISITETALIFLHKIINNMTLNRSINFSGSSILAGNQRIFYCMYIWTTYVQTPNRTMNDPCLAYQNNIITIISHMHAYSSSPLCFVAVKKYISYVWEG